MSQDWQKRVQSPGLPDAIKSFELLVDDGEAQNVKARRELISTLEQSWKQSRGYTEVQRTYADMLWRYACLEKARGNPDALKEIREAVTRMRADAIVEPAQKWLDQIDKAEGPRPKDAGIKSISDPNQLKPQR